MSETIPPVEDETIPPIDPESIRPVEAETIPPIETPSKPTLSIDISEYMMGKTYIYTQEIHETFDTTLSMVENSSTTIDNFDVQLTNLFAHFKKFTFSKGDEQTSVEYTVDNETIVISKQNSKGGSTGKVYDAIYRKDSGKEIRHKIKMVEIGDSPEEKITMAINMLRETLIHILCLRALNSDTTSTKMQQKNVMACIPALYGICLCVHNEKTYFCVLIETLTNTIHSFLSEKTSHSGVSGAVSIIMYQVATLLEFLNKTIQFSHRDLKMDNVMYQIDDSRTNNTLCNDNFYHAYVIDFGFSVCTDPVSGTLIATNSFYNISPPQMANPAHDIVFFIWSMKKTIQCNKYVRNGQDTHFAPCEKLTPTLNLVLDTVLKSSGIPFWNINNNTDTENLYTFLPFVGMSQEESTVTINSLRGEQKNHVNKLYLSLKVILRLLRAVMKIVALECNGVSRQNIGKLEAHTLIRTFIENYSEEFDDNIDSVEFMVKKRFV